MSSAASRSGARARRIAFASGKGGTGKTLLATNLAAWLAEQRPVTYVDADVEEPDGHLFLHPTTAREERFAVTVPQVREDRCAHCGACQRACAWHAILALPDEVLVLPELCHGCGVCALACPNDAIEEVERAIGTIARGRAGPLTTITGTLDVGEARATPLVAGTVAAGTGDGETPDTETRDGETEGGEAGPAPTVVVDCPPGTSCAAMASVRGADLVVLVTEPTPFGLHDLRLAVAMCRALGRPVAAVLNRADLGDAAVPRFLAAEGVPLVATIPFEPGLARAYADGRLAFAASLALRDALAAILAHAEAGTGSEGEGA